VTQWQTTQTRLWSEKNSSHVQSDNLWKIKFFITLVAWSIFRPFSQTHFSKSEFKNEISSSALLDIQITLLCVCGVDSVIPEFEHLIEKLFHGLFSKKMPLKSDFMDSDSWNEAEVNLFSREKHFRRDYLDYLKKRSKIWRYGRSWTHFYKSESGKVVRKLIRLLAVPPPPNQIYSQNWYPFLCWNSQSFHLHSGEVSLFTSQAMSSSGSFRTLIVHGSCTGSKTVRIWLKIDRIHFPDILRWKFDLFLSEPGWDWSAKVTVQWVYGMEFS